MSFKKILISADVINEKSNLNMIRSDSSGSILINNMTVDFADCTTKEAAEKAAKMEARKLLKEAIDALKD